jgi:aubergine-like protein
MLTEHRDLLGPIKMFDGQILFLPICLENESTQVFSVRKTDGEKITITIRRTNEIMPTDPTCLQLYNIIFKRVLTQNKMNAIGRNYYNPKDAVRIPQHGLEVWPGFSTSILQFENSTMLIADVSHKILHSKSVLDTMYDLYDSCRGGNFKDICAKKIIGQIVLTRYNNKTYRVDDIDWSSNPTSKFMKSDKVEISYIDYYKQAYDMDIKDYKQPLLLSLPKARDRRRGQEGPLCLLPELCSLTGLADEVRADFNVMKDLAVHTRIGPGDRVKRLQKFVQDINKNPDSVAEMRNWNLEFSSDLLTMTGRQLPTEKICQNDPRAAYTYQSATADWSREMRGQKLLSAAHLTNWVMIFTQRDANSASDLFSTLQKVCPPMGMQIQKPKLIQLPDDTTASYVRALKESITKDVCMVLVVLPSNRKDRYDSIKTVCCVDMPVPSQVVLGRTLSKKQMLMSVATKIAIQLNCKMGGEVWAVEMPIKNTMVVGIDTYHDSAKKGRSVGAFVASMNQNLTRYYSRCAFQSSQEELHNALRVCMQSALKNYHGINGVLPDRVIVYRDGVGDGQLGVVHEHELRQMTECFKAIGPDYCPKLAVIVVKKRINSRFFAADRQISNPPPGTVVDTQATRPEWYDFFVISQSVRQGTVSPTHYNVIFDSTGFKPDNMQRLAYKLCHLYYNWPGTIRVPAPCQYAHKMAFLVGQSLHKDPSLSLANKLFFL